MPQTGELLSLFGWVAVAAIIAVAGLLVAFAVRRWSQREDVPETFTFQDLREMRERGDITEHEYRAMRSNLLAGFDMDDSGPAGPSAGPSGPVERGES